MALKQRHANISSAADQLRASQPVSGAPVGANGASVVDVRSYAKVNLDLRVLHRRPDGFHEIRSLFHTISLADQIRISWKPGRKLRIVTVCPGLPIAMEENLAHRAAVLFCERAKLRGDLHVEINKQIPAGGGLGGGSSNAASVLLALPALTGAFPGVPDLLAMATRLGSDLPFFMMGGAAVGLGRGEELYPLPDFPALHGVLAAPGIAVSTADAYRALQRKLEPNPYQSEAFATLVREFCGEFTAPSAMVTRWNGVALGRNDFENPVFGRHPELAAWRDSFLAAGAVHAMMSGSGSTVFGLWADREQARRALLLQGHGVTKPFRLVSRARYQRDWLARLYPFAHSQLWPPQSNSKAIASRV